MQSYTDVSARVRPAAQMLSSWSTFAQQFWKLLCGLTIQGVEAVNPPVSEGTLDTLQLNRIAQNFLSPLKLKFQAEKELWLRKCRHMGAINHWALQSGDAKQKKKGSLARCCKGKI